MRKIITSREVRDLLFTLAAIMLSVVVCVASISQANMVGIVVSILLLSVLCVAFGYIYCKYEEKLFALCEKNEAEEQEKEADSEADFDIPKLFKEAVAEVANAEKNDIDKKKIV